MVNKLAINTLGDELEAAAAFCREQGIGIEVTDFAFPGNLDGDMAERIKRHTVAITGISPVISHGPFLDLIAHSQDPAIVDVTRQRHTASLRAAREIGATLYIAHTNYNPLIRNAAYVKNFTQRMREFWLPFADEAAKSQTVICLENLWEAGPEIQDELISAAGHPSLKASFDNGHALVFSAEPAKYWIETLGENLAHCHLHDNSGEADEHKSVGEGKENWAELIEAARTFSPQAVLVTESDYLERNKISLEKLRSFYTDGRIVKSG
ncbi:MAG: sugar phosphate isomerase/epimerase [Chloroflexi bacterium]|nr:sugar phosphate isomerase/epimerase [Chloroflexota bacterium]